MVPEDHLLHMAPSANFFCSFWGFASADSECVQAAHSRSSRPGSSKQLFVLAKATLNRRCFHVPSPSLVKPQDFVGVELSSASQNLVAFASAYHLEAEFV